MQREARRPTSSGGLTAQEPLLRQLGRQVESTPSQPRWAEGSGETIEALDRLQHQAEERERQRRLLQQWQQQLIRRPPSASQYGGPSLLSDLGRHLQSMPPQPPAFTGFGGTIEALNRLQHQAEERERQQQLVQQWQQQLNRRPVAAGAVGGPSLLSDLGRHLQSMPPQPPAFTGIGSTMEALDRIQHQAEERERQQQLVQQWQQQLDRRPFAAGAVGGPSLLAQLGPQFGPMSQPGGAFSGFGGNAYPSSWQMLGTHLAHFG